MTQTRQAHLLALLRDGHPFRVAVILTAHFFNVHASTIEREFYRS